MIILAQRIFITATNTDIGKTYATKRLIKAFSSLGYRVGVFKPIETGVLDQPLDGTELLTTVQQYNPAFKALSVNDIVPIQFQLPAAPYIANQTKPINFERIESALEKIEPLCDILLIEGAGGLLVPLDQENMVIDLIKRFEAKVLLVSHCRLGCINDTLLNLTLLKQAGLTYNWALNCKSDDTDFKEISEPYFADHFPDYYELSRDIKKLATSLLNL
ncbi:MAG: dethiobiotin synthase [Campylobacterota bacterium]|nr:dethiobiotin synthase [Campylobacterota bacterium]